LEFGEIGGIIRDANGGSSMKRRIVIWAVAGFMVADLWAVYAAATFPSPLTSYSVVWPLVNLTCPVAFASFHFHFGIKLYWVLLANALTYALVGLAVENLRQRLSPS
jgi:hypothetical protein